MCLTAGSEASLPRGAASPLPEILTDGRKFWRAGLLPVIMKRDTQHHDNRCRFLVKHNSVFNYTGDLLFEGPEDMKESNPQLTANWRNT